MTQDISSTIKGYRFSAVAAGVKNPESDRLDMALSAGLCLVAAALVGMVGAFIPSLRASRRELDPELSSPARSPTRACSAASA